MTKRAKPMMHGRDHAPDGPDPIPTPDTAAPDLVYAAVSAMWTIVTAGLSEYMLFGSYAEGSASGRDSHASGVGFNDATGSIEIFTAGVYQVLGVGLGVVMGPAAKYATAGVFGPYLQVTAECTPHIHAQGAIATAESAVDIPSGGRWSTPMVLLDQNQYEVGDVIKFQALNDTSVDCTFSGFRFVVTLLEAT